MGRYFIKMTEGEDKFWYLQWSDVVDAPLTIGMTKDELFDLVRHENHGQIPNWWWAAWKRLQDTGASAHGAGSALDVILANRAGAGESCLSYDEIVEQYCRRRGRGNPIKGRHTHIGVGAVEHCRSPVAAPVATSAELGELVAARKGKRG